MGAVLIRTGASHGVLLSPFPSYSVVLFPVSLVDAGNLRYKGVIWVWVTQQRADRQENFGDGEGGGPLRPQYVETDASVAVDIRVVDSCGERNLWRFEGVVCGEVDREEKHSTLVRTVIGSHYCRLPMKHVISYWSG